MHILLEVMKIILTVDFPVQYVIRPQSKEYPDYRGYAGRIAGGVFKAGDKIKILPSGIDSTIKSIDTYNGKIEEA